jgi:alpha-mannosidase
MRFEELIILLPCHSLEDFPVYQEGPQAEGLLAAWSALWHPALIASAGKLPTWHRADGPPNELAHRLLVIPPASDALLLAGWASRAQTDGACVVRKLQRRNEIVAASLACLDGGPGKVETELADDFFALGLGYLLVELLTRQMRYMSNIDEPHLRIEAVAAARAAVEGQTESARNRLRNCFDVLTEARERFYPVAAYLVDLLLVAPTTLGAGLRRELADATPKNVLISGQLVDQLGRTDMGTLAALRSALEQGTASLVGGEFDERELPLLPIESVLSELKQGAAVYRQWLGAAPTVYGRRRFGLSPVLPQVLSQLGYQGAVHATLDEGQFPKPAQSKTRWEGFDSRAIDALGRLPLDANLPESMLGFPRKMGEAMDHDHVATLVFAHWPGQTSPFFADLRRIASFAPCLGKFVTLADYFANTQRPADVTRFRADQYRAPYLRQAIIRQDSDSLSRLASQHHIRLQAEARQSLSTMVAAVTAASRTVAESAGSAQPAAAEVRTRHDLEGAHEADRQAEMARRFAKSLGQDAGGGVAGYLVVNPQLFARRVLVATPDLPCPPDCRPPLAAVQTSREPTRVVVDVAPMGFAWIGPGAAEPAKAKSKPAKSKPSKEAAISNEFLEVIVHQETGGIRAIRETNQRGNRMSQQLAFRLPSPRPKAGDLWRDPDEEAIYSASAIDSIEVLAGEALGQIVSRGRLLDLEGSLLASFQQTTTLVRGTRVVMLDIELDVRHEPRADPWGSYYASRFAWSDEAAELRRGVSLTSQPTEAKHIEAPNFIEVRSDKWRAAILTGGWPYHRRIGLRMLDSLLVVRGETERRFRLAIGVGLAHPAAAAIDLLAPAVVVPGAPAPTNGAGWLFHLDVKNIVATHWEPFDEAGRTVGFRVRLLEVEGRSGEARLRALRPMAAARRIDFLDQSLAVLSAEGDCIPFEFSAYEWLEIEARWAERP